MKHKLLFLSVILTALSFSAKGQNYMEIPLKNDTNAIYNTVYTTIDGNQMRSFTYKYDPQLKVSLWVAYPLNSKLIGTGSRGEEWEPDPMVDSSLQPVLYKGFAYGSGYDRGHQIPSADRLNSDANKQTFTFINATPQLHDFNGGVWAELEKRVRTWAKHSDTLYVVTGVIPGKEYIKDNIGQPVNIPSAYYKVFLRRYTSKYGSVVWSTNAILMPHEIFRVGTWQENAKLFQLHSMSISELEGITGEIYFPGLKTILGKENAKKLKAQSPISDKWWWK